MGNLVLPQKVTVQLIDGFGAPFEISDVIVTVHLFARHKNDFYLGPYFSDNSGKVIISNKDLVLSIKSTLSSGLMDYYPVNDCYSFVEVFVDQPEDVARALNAREKYWVTLLDGEKERWGTMKNLLSVYRRAKNKEIKISKELSRVRDEWGGEKDECVYNLLVNKK